MEVILNSEIARLVLGYLKDQNLERAHRKFCQTSKYLKDEYELLCRGYQPVSVSNSNLVEIIKEYCEIKSQINQFVNLFPNEILGNIQSQPNLTKRLEFILSKANREILREVDAGFTERHATKRKRSISITSSTSDSESKDHDSSFVKPSSYYRKNKLFKLHSPNIGYTLLRSKDKNKVLKSRCSNESTNDETDNIPLSTSADLTVLKETLLENTEFQNKLADNINKIMNSSATDNDKKGEEQADPKGTGNSNQIQFAIDSAIDNIINTIEQDPIFDHIVQDVLNHQSVIYDEGLQIINGGHIDCNAQIENEGHESPGISRTSTPKKETEMSTNTVFDPTVALISTIDEQQPMVNDPNVDIVPENSDIQNLQNFTSTISNFIITPKSITTQAQHQNNQSNLIFINEPTFNSAMPLLNLNSASSNQFPILMSSSLLNETNITMPFLINSSPCVPISNSQFPVNFITQQQTLPPVPVRVVRRGRPRKIIPPLQQQTAVTNTQTQPYQINQPIGEIIKNNAITMRSVVNTNPAAVVNSSPNVLRAATSSENTTCNNVIYTAAASQMQSITVSAENKIVADIINIADVHPPIVHSKIENYENVLNSNKTDVAFNNEIIIHMTDSLPKQPCIIEPTELSVKPIQEELQPIQIASSIEKMDSATPKQNMKPIENLKVKSNSTPRRKSHVRILDFTTPGRSEIVPQMPRTIERSIHLQKKKSANGTRLAELRKLQSKERTKKCYQSKDQGITTTPKVKKNASTCVRVLSRSASEENYEKENENTDSNSEIQKIGKTGDVKLATNLSPIDEWKQLRNISQTKNWDSYLRFVSAVDTVNKAKIKKSDELARRKVRKLKPVNERTQDNRTVKRLKKPIRKSPRLQKKRKGKVPEKKQLRRSVEELKEPKEIKESPTPVELNTEPKKEVNKQLADKAIEKVLAELEEVTPEASSPNKEVSVPVIHHHSMASLLETPFKTDTLQQSNPITPRFLPPSAVEDTPITKILKSLNKHLGSELKSDIFTPNFAITPGCNLTPPKALDIMTPQSGSFSNRPTDYSSGSSYYRPDESDDKIESLASTIRNKSAVHEFEYEAITTKLAQTDHDQKLVVECPGLLEKIKSFSENSNPIREDVVPHYTFNKPDESVENVETEVKDTDTSSSSSSSGSSSPFSTSSSSSSDSSNTSYHPKSEPNSVTTKIIDDQGETRYPIRTWITPKKIDNLEVLPVQNKPSTSALLVNKQTILNELEEKRIRMRDQIKISEKSDSHVKKTKPVGNFKCKNKMNPRQGAKQSLISVKPAAILADDKVKQPRKNPTPKKLVPLKSDKKESVDGPPITSAVYKDDVNELISVLSDGQVPKMSDKVSIKSDDIELAEEFKDAYQNATSDDEDDDECEIVFQSDVFNIVHDEKSSNQIKLNQLNMYKDYLLSSKGVMNVNIDGRKIQIKANDLLTLYEYVPNKLTTNSKTNVGRPKNIENSEKYESRKSDSKYNNKGRKGKSDAPQSTKSSKTVRNDKKCINHPVHVNLDKKSKNEKQVLPAVKIPEPETSRSSAVNAKAQFNVKYKIPKTQNRSKPVKKTILSQPVGSNSTTVPATSGDTGRPDAPETFKIPFKVDMKNKQKSSSSDTINAVLAHLHGTE